MNTDGPLRLVQVDAGGLGRARLDTIGANPAQFFKAPHLGGFREELGGFREEMDHVLLLDMAIHPFIAVRHVTGQDAVGVSCEKFNRAGAGSNPTPLLPPALSSPAGFALCTRGRGVPTVQKCRGMGAGA